MAPMAIITVAIITMAIITMAIIIIIIGLHDLVLCTQPILPSNPVRDSNRAITIAEMLPPYTIHYRRLPSRDAHLSSP
jgi:hypothetical protein